MPPSEHDVLRRALRETFGAHDGELLVRPGEGPRDCPAPLPLGGVPLVGSIETRRHEARFYSAMVLLDVPFASETPTEADFAALGWRPKPHTFPPPAGLVADSELASWRPPDGPPQSYLHDGARVVLHRHPGGLEDGARATWRVEAGPSFEHWAGDFLATLPPVPVLAPPPGAVVRPLGGGAGGSPDLTHASTSALVEGGGNADALRAHYAAQLRAAGWREEGGAPDVWRGPNGEGAVWGVLSVRTLPDGRALAHFLALHERPEGEGGRERHFSGYQF